MRSCRLENQNRDGGSVSEKIQETTKTAQLFIEGCLQTGLVLNAADFVHFLEGANPIAKITK